MNDAYNTRLAQLGFIVITVGHRGGSPMRGKAYHRYGYGNMRDYALEDDKCAIEQLAARHSFIDITKVGIFGHSGGGFMAAAALCKYPDFIRQQLPVPATTTIVFTIGVGWRFITE